MYPTSKNIIIKFSKINKYIQKDELKEKNKKIRIEKSWNKVKSIFNLERILYKTKSINRIK